MTGKIRIDALRAINLLREIVDEHGRDHRYSRNSGDGRCRYERGGAPACLIGHVLHRAGVPVNELARMDLAPVFASTEISEVVLPDVVDMTDTARVVLGAAQHVQDHGETWGRALDAAEDVVRGGDGRHRRGAL